MSEPVRAGLSPVYRRDARLLILGSFPGEKSLAAERYYAHPRNHFWKLVGGVCGREFADLDYGARLDQLCDCHVALWDMAASARRKGSLDANLRVEVLADVAGLIARLPTLRAVAFNGGQAWRLGLRLVLPPGVAAIALPSSSPANTAPFAAKQAVWENLRNFL